MCFVKCTRCRATFHTSKADDHNCDWTPTFRPWRALETVDAGGDPQVLIEYLAAEIDVLRQQAEEQR